MSDNTSPIAKVFGTFELLEPILLKVDVCTVLLSQRVNYFFKSCIKKSSPLQQKLLFKLPDPEEMPASHPYYLRRNLLLRAKGPYVHIPGLRSFYLIRSEATIEDEDIPEVEFTNFNLEMLRKTLNTYRPSFLDMYIFRTKIRKGLLTIRNEDAKADSSRIDWDFV
ncbi:uncharacterized protein MYCFIDRAFT_85566 [Pseudocercospora fijiensis CIRAD86]|uniref:F-box domain-containing protein n=1 Tax=Pseudocercospora fijiensis (strain CIRAD86) TaxID=383855 RepID=M3ANT5_PSEFD|nr:uncharacterized protein MYCFIDRAFT_85566 [Pseudocercospora fijiensis CIRAD86]EME78758.1 hypothetical protein MYCFIDRAFT_85566 [Pseudocercospora fijiensis CIRAD86]